jgi:hypothetical protein
LPSNAAVLFDRSKIPIGLRLFGLTQKSRSTGWDDNACRRRSLPRLVINRVAVYAPGRQRADGLLDLVQQVRLRRDITDMIGSHMYPGKHLTTRSNQLALVMSSTGETIGYAALEARTNRLAHLLRTKGLNREDHYAIFMENNARYVETCGAGERSGLYYTCVNAFLTADELAYILNNSESKLLITSKAKRDVALAALPQCPNVASCLITDGPGDGAAIINLDEATDGLPDTPHRR